MSGRVVPYYCPYCGEEDLRPYEPEPDSDVEIRSGWHCRDCTRVFSLKYHGMAAPPTVEAPFTGGSTPPDPESE
ncbi:hypothetical protein L0U85_12780 [Glycomyces sp. L485]|uniref:hypothetical protein n=1 Tax=Glycomyces sp. L485 TaxID=2909235 RepID=UPI001F4A20AC|nr:hypothetical protein [Glycomyces sp. L485]MCH7231719.1 hypothetical protein [Glycomyces sp. L485]